MKKLIVTALLLVVGGLTGIFAQPYLPVEWQGWLDDQHVRIAHVVNAVETDDGGAMDKALVAADAFARAPDSSR